MPPWTGRSPNRERRTKTRKRLSLQNCQSRRAKRKSKGQRGRRERRERAPPVSVVYSAGLRPSQRRAPPVAPPCSRLHLPSRRFEKPLERGRALTPTASHPPIGSELPHPFPSHQAWWGIQAEESGGEIRQENPTGFVGGFLLHVPYARVLGPFPTRKGS